jgi:hypothetical protein
MLIANSNLGNLYKMPQFHVVLKVLSTTKNTTAVDILLNFKCT